MTLGRDSPKFCPRCAAPLKRHRVGGELRNHWICGACGALHYDHPMVVVKCFVTWRDRLLWVRRGIEPLYGLWAIPGGFLESGETLAQGAAREVAEEAGVVLREELLELYMLGTLTFINQVHVAFRTAVDSPDCAPGVESLECRFYTRDQAPWEVMAHPEVRDAMEQAYEDMERGSYGIWQTELGVNAYVRRQVRQE